MKRWAFGDLPYFLAALVLIFVFVVYPVSVFSPEYYGRNILPSYYTAVFGVTCVYIWAYFVVPRFIVRRCRSCGSRNMLFSYQKLFCGDCGYVFVIDSLRGYERWKLITLILAGPVTLIGVCLAVGCALAGVMHPGLLFFAVLLSVYFPSVAAVFLGLYKLFGRFAASFVREHKGAATTTFFIIFCILAFLVLAGYWIPLEKIFESIYGNLKP